MLRAVRHLWAHHRLAFLAFLAAAAVMLFFTVRLVIFTVYWADPMHRNQPPEPWMTPGYIAHSWGLDPDTVIAALGVVPRPGERPTLEQIAKDRGVPVEVVIAEVAALLAARAGGE